MIHEYTCITCKFVFKSRKLNKKYCSHKCYSSRFSPVKLLCEVCNNQFVVAYRFRGIKTCSLKCRSSLQSMKTSTRETKQCLLCSNDFEVTQSYKNKGKYCSLICFYKHKYNRDSTIVTLTCENCKKEYVKKFIKRKSRFCSRTCATSGKFNAFYQKFGQAHPTFGKKSWNHGLTTKTDKRVESLGKKISIISKKQFVEGIRSHVGPNNPNYGNTSDTISFEKRLRFSEAAIKRVLSGVSGYKTGHITGEYVGKKTPKLVKYKSSWELAIMMWWDEQNDVVQYEYEPTIFRLSTGLKAIPDFLVSYSNNSQIYVEIKPTQLQELYKEKLNLVKKSVEKQGFTYVLFGNKEIDFAKKELGDKFINAIKRN